jgi:preprotein translocase subunit SecA
LRTGVIGTHLPCVRVDEPDRLYLTGAQRDAAAAERVRAAHAAGRPVLVGTRSVGDSERFAALLAAAGVSAVVLNAKNDAAEAAIVARAGRRGAVTVSTQMAGRGVDIVLGPGAAEAGGLLVLGLGGYDSPRLDRQLRGRSGRQGDPGGSAFYTSMDDHVVAENIVLGIAPRRVAADGLIDDARFTELYAHAQRVAEGKVMQLHRTTRRYHTATDRHRRIVLDVRERILADDDALADYLGRIWGADDARVGHWCGPGERRALAREVVLYHLDLAWSDHLNLLAEAREGIHLRVLGRQNPLDEFNLLAADDFRRASDQAADAIRDTLDRAGPDAAVLADLGLRRPSSTWTYMIADNPFGSEADRVLATLGRVVRRGRPRAVRYT